MHFYGWKRGLKTGIYYLRTKPSAQAIQFTIDASTAKQAKTNAAEAASAKAAIALPTPSPTPQSGTSVNSLIAPMRQVSIATTATKPIAAPEEAKRDSSPGPSEEEEISYEEAKRRADERAEAALQCSIDNKDACMMCSG